MIFNRSYRVNSSKPLDAVLDNLKGQHIKVHNFDFEVYDKDGTLRIIPHAENEDGITTLPITRLNLKPKKSGTEINIDTHPRRIDIGGPYILVIFCLVIFFLGLIVGIYGGKDYEQTSMVLTILPLVIFSIFWIKMELGYFDYVRKIKTWVKTKVS
jgi:hypothetical protein